MQGIKPLWQMEKEIHPARAGHNRQDVASAASMLEISPSTLYRKLQQWRDKDDVAVVYGTRG